MHQICRFCRFEKCLKAGMKRAGVQPRKAHQHQRRTFCTKSGLKRNKRFAVVAPMSREEVQQVEEVIQEFSRKESIPRGRNVLKKFVKVTEHPQTSTDSSSADCTPIGSPIEKPKPIYHNYNSPAISIASPPAFVMKQEQSEDVSPDFSG
ncbi:hypothetical protein NECAME_09867 [Necator americanus]|uniref:Zinc finger, C4 type n=1 Tax=Necator americanus TaxID=51031 RepID=W2TCP5_NECAM|nr:hypothetical protein NECAME_09867 [Necator americanus]ETN79369.1 hypothetical protein NECAME_09867 [Necator americanus]